MAQTPRVGPAELQRPLPKETEEGWGCPLAFQPCVLGLVEAGVAGPEWGTRPWRGVGWAALKCLALPVYSGNACSELDWSGQARQQGSGLAACLPELLKD